MKLYIIVLLLTIFKYNEAKLSTTKEKPNVPQNAIIAIQIIDPNENKTSSKNSKRTIDSALGYGYQGGKQSQPKYEIYKYSQHDIPPFTPNQYTASSNYQVQNVVSKPAAVTPGLSNYYQPGTILFSTINQNGKLGQLSSQFPGSLDSHQYPIPVIILRVHPDQLANPLYPKLPQNHLHASAINSIDINSLLSNYIENNKQQSAVQHQQPVQEEPVYQQPVQQEPVYQQQYQEDNQSNQVYVPQTDSAQYQSVDYQSSDYQSQQYYPQQYQYDEEQDRNQGYQSQQQVSQNYQSQQDHPDPRVPSGDLNYQYSNNYQVPSPAYYQAPAQVETYKSTELLTDENYPSEKHTQVIFKRSKGKSPMRNKQLYRSVQQIQPTKSQVPAQESQPQSDNVRQSPANYYQPSFYTVQYTDDQGYANPKAPSYRVRERNEDAHMEQTRKYVYVSSH